MEAETKKVDSSCYWRVAGPDHVRDKNWGHITSGTKTGNGQTMSRTKIEARLLLRQKEILDPRENLLAAENNNGKMEIVI